MIGDSKATKGAAGHGKVDCRECGKHYHRLDVHLSAKHKMTVAQYKEKHGEETAIYSEAVKIKLKEHAKKHLGIPKGTHKVVGGKLVRKEDIGKGDAGETGDTGKVKKEAPIERDPSLLHMGVAEIKIRDDLTDLDLPYVPEHDSHWKIGDSEKEIWEAILLGVVEHENVLMTGPTGAGKSSSVEQLAAAINQPVRRMNLRRDIRGANFVGETKVVVDKETGLQVTRWEDGILPQAMKRGQWLLLDELDAAPPQILFVLQSVLEQNGKLVLTGNGGEVVKKHKNFRVIATANTLGRGDDTGLYTGTNVLNEAFLDRFGMVVEYGYPSESVEVDILVAKTGVNKETARRMVRTANRVREAFDKEEVACTFSTRRLIAWASKANAYKEIGKASKFTILNKLSGDDRQVVEGVINRYFTTGESL